MSLLKGLWVAVAVLSLAGCNTVYSTQPVGETVVAVAPEEWEGTWINSSMDTPVSIKVMDAQKGTLKAAWIHDMEMETWDVHLRESGQWMFGSMKGSKQDNRLVWGRIKKDGNEVIIWTPDTAKISDLVKAGSLPGTVDEGGDVTLGELKAEHMRLIMSEDKVVLDWANPIVLIKLSR